MDSHELALLALARSLGAALAVGVLVGLERGWRERRAMEGRRIAGFRTFTLIALLGGVLAEMSETFGAWPLAAGLAGVAALFVVSYRQSVQASSSVSVTSAIAALLTFALGAWAAAGQAMQAIAVAVIVATILSLKPVLHRWLRLIEGREIAAALQLLVLSVVVLPLLPDAGYGPYQALNPYRLWWAVVLIAGLSMMGHVAMRITGQQRGLMLSAMLGGLVSSTAVTVDLARRTRNTPALNGIALSGVMAASGIKFLRVGIVAIALQPRLADTLVPVLLAATLVALVLAWLAWRKRPASGTVRAESAEQSLFDLSTALGVALFLGVVAVLGRAAQQTWGTSGLHGVAVLSGLADVDPIVVTAARMSADALISDGTAVLTIMLAAGGNLLSKTAIAWAAGNRTLGLRVGGGYLLVALAGVLAWLLAGGAAD
ncbi:MAG: MgtC/SapB family protein [Burkholderiales bacterium]|nr:MgtC/SapB family protein [Burkholderiales bacterium]